MAFSGIDQMIALAREAADAFDSATDEVLNEAIDVALDRNENRALARYVARCRTEAKDAMRSFATMEGPVDIPSVLACHSKIKDYYRVAHYVSEQLGALAGPDPEDDTVIEDGEGD